MRGFSPGAYVLDDQYSCEPDDSGGGRVRRDGASHRVSYRCRGVLMVTTTVTMALTYNGRRGILRILLPQVDRLRSTKNAAAAPPTTATMMTTPMITSALTPSSAGGAITGVAVAVGATAVAVGVSVAVGTAAGGALGSAPRAASQQRTVSLGGGGDPQRRRRGAGMAQSRPYPLVWAKSIATNRSKRLELIPRYGGTVEILYGLIANGRRGLFVRSAEGPVSVGLLRLTRHKCAESRQEF